MRRRAAAPCRSWCARSARCRPCHRRHCAVRRIRRVLTSRCRCRRIMSRRRGLTGRAPPPLGRWRMVRRLTSTWRSSFASRRTSGWRTGREQRAGRRRRSSPATERTGAGRGPVRGPRRATACLQRKLLRCSLARLAADGFGSAPAPTSSTLSSRRYTCSGCARPRAQASTPNSGTSIGVCPSGGATPSASSARSCGTASSSTPSQACTTLWATSRRSHACRCSVSRPSATTLSRRCREAPPIADSRRGGSTCAATTRRTRYRWRTGASAITIWRARLQSARGRVTTCGSSSRWAASTR